MADIELVIKIPVSLYANLSKINHETVAGKRILECVKNGTPLPKGHGRLIDSKALGDYFWEHRSKLFTHKDLQSVIDYAPTIIEADKESD